jgi:hypothetical protein
MMPIQLDATVTTESVQTDGGSPSSPNLGQPDMRPNPTKSDSPSMPQKEPDPVLPILRDREVRLTSIPEARVIINGKLVGSTPYLVRIQEPSKLTSIELWRAGFKVWRHTLSKHDTFVVDRDKEILELNAVLKLDSPRPTSRSAGTANKHSARKINTATLDDAPLDGQLEASAAPRKDVSSNRNEIPEQLSFAVIFATIKQIDASDCKKSDSGGFFKIDLRIQRNGQADASAADGTREAACIAEKIKKLTFPEFRGPPISMTYPYPIR